MAEESDIDALAFAKKRIATVEALAKISWKKINLMHGTESEGVWCVPVTKKDGRKMEDDLSYDDPVRVYLVNMPLGWGGRTWGAEVIGLTRGASRAVALSQDQTPLDADTKLLWRGLRLRTEEEAAIKWSFHVPYLVIIFLDLALCELKKPDTDIMAVLIRMFSDPAKPDGNAILAGMKREFPRDGGYDYTALCAKITEMLT